MRDHMNSLEKLQVLLQHWIEHNHGHLHDFEKWKAAMNDEGQTVLAEKLQGVIEMAGAVCHEMNQPMQVVLGISELLLLNKLEDNHFYKQIEALKNVKSLTARMFTKHEKASNHCQIENFKLALEEILIFL